SHKAMSQQVRMNDSIDLAIVSHILDTYGWLGRSVIGETANEAIALTIQHATYDTVTQQKYLPMLEQSAEAGETDGQYLALLKDRILMRDHQNQIYGTQIWKNPKASKQE